MGRRVMLGSYVRAAGIGFVMLCLAGCYGRDNGVPGDLLSLMKERGMNLQPTRVAGPLSKRHGYIVVPFDDRLQGQLISTLRLRQINSEDPHWRSANHGISGLGTWQELWGITGRPPELKLADGGQFEFLYLLRTPTGEIILFTEYAYG